MPPKIERLSNHVIFPDELDGTRCRASRTWRRSMLVMVPWGLPSGTSPLSVHPFRPSTLHFSAEVSGKKREGGGAAAPPSRRSTQRPTAGRPSARPLSRLLFWLKEQNFCSSKALYNGSVGVKTTTSTDTYRYVV